MPRARIAWTLLAAVGITGALVASRASSTPAPEVDSNLVTALTRVGLPSEPLAAAGVSTSATTDLVGRVETYLDAHPLVIDTADAGYATAKQNADRLERLVKSGLGRPEDVSAYQQAAQDLAAATSTRQQTLDAVFNAGTAALAENQKTIPAPPREPGRLWSAPLEFLVVVSRSESDWVHLKQALANEKIAPRYGEDPDPGDQQFLATCRADGAVVTAKSNLDTNLAGVKAAWLAAVAQ
ncbi:MAG: hypothetical protein U1E76_06665 [Planctomycetota bacterium]